jgi:hypothetical protein
MKARISLVSLSARIRTVQGILAAFKGLRTVFTDDFHFYPFYKFWLVCQVPTPVQLGVTMPKKTYQHYTRP